MEIRVANKKDVWHLIQRGMLTQFHFDFEGFGLDTKHAQIASYGDAVGDIAGNFSNSEEIEVKRPDRYISTPQALAVTRTSPHELDKEERLPHRVAMAKIAQRFETSPLAAASFGEETIESFHTLRKKGEDYYPKNKKEPVIHYPLFDPDKKMEIDEDGNIITDPPGMLKLNDKGEVVFGTDEKVVKIPKATGTEWNAEEGREVPVYKYVPMKPEDGAITFDVRIHPGRNMIAYKFDDDPHSPYYENIENGIYVDGHVNEKADYNEEGKKRDEGKAKWKMSEARLLISGYRIKWYDIPLLRTNLVRAGFHPSNIFFTHSKSTISKKQLPKNFAVDGYSAVINTHLYGPQGEEGLQIGTRTDNRTGEKVPSAKLELVMANNTRFENKERDVREGVFMPDGSIYDGRKGHKSPAYDSLASFAIYNYCREIAPNIMQMQELQADEDYLRDMLPGMDLTESYPPIYAMMRNSYPDEPVADPMAFVGFDDQQGQLRRAITMRLDLGDLKNFTYKGKTLEQMAREDLKQSDPSQRNFVRMIREQGRAPDSLIRVDSLRKFHGVEKIGDAMHSASAQNWDLEEIDDNFRFLVDKNNEFVLEAIRDAVEVLNWDMRSEPDPPNPNLEEQWPFNSFGDIDYLEFQAREEIVKRKNMPRKGQTEGVVQMLYEKAMDVFKYHNTIDELLHRLAIQPNPVDLYGYDDNLNLRDAVGNYWELFQKVKTRLGEKECPYVSIFDDCYTEDGKFNPPGTVIEAIEPKNEDGEVRFKTKKLEDMSHTELENAIEEIQKFRWDLMARMLEDDELERNDSRSEYGNGLFDQKYTKKGRIVCANLSRDFRIVDERGRELSIQYLKRQYGHQPHILQQRLESGEWRIQFYRQTSEPTTSVILMQFADMGKLDELPQLWQFRYRALRALCLHGAPNEDASNMRTDAIPVLEKALLALEVNHQIDDEESLGRVFSRYVSGEAEVFLRSEEGQRFLAEYREYLEKIKQEFPFKDEYKMTVGFDPETGLPYDWIEHEIDVDNFVVIDVPDPHLRNPIEDIRQAPYSLVIRKLSNEDRQKIRQGADVVLRGVQTGRLYHPGKASVLKAPDETASYEDYYEDARRAYKDEAGVSFPNIENRQILRVQELMPIGNARAIDPKIQTFKVPSTHFDGLVCPRMAYFNEDEPLTGLVLPADYCPQDVEEGKPIRFREMKASMGSKMLGKEGLETGFIYESTLRKARTMTVGQLMEQISQGNVTDETAKHCGYAGAYDMWEKINQAFLDRESPDPMEEEVILLEFDQVDKKSSAYVNLFKAPKAAFIHDGKPVSPSPFRANAGNDNVAYRNSVANDSRTEVEVREQDGPDTAPGLG